MSLISSRQHAAVRHTFVGGVVCFAACLLLAGGSPRAQAQHHPKRVERGTIESLEKQWQKAQLADDVTAMDKLLSDDYLGITSSGELLTKAQQLDRMRNRRIVLSQLEVTDTKIKLIGPVAIVTCLTNIKGTNDGAPVVGEYRNTRIYQRLPNSVVWRITSFTATPVPLSRHKAPGR
jgi:ketosteroid isomerase-like protein